MALAARQRLACGLADVHHAQHHAMPLDAQDLLALSRLLDEALELPAGEREAWLAGLPAADQRHAAQLREMLADHDQRTASGPLSTLPRLGDDPPGARPGDSVGPYRLLRLVGQGGMGSVWMAERSDGAFQRRVALKLPRLSWSDGLAQRMARERDIGALLEHPHIARLYDAGVDALGRPYLAMEYVDGQPIDAHCRQQGLDIPARLRLLVQVARAVGYAHGRLVIHRDLKPSNVLVTAAGEVFLVDFGIAKLMGDAAPGSTLTQAQGRVLTPQYAAPEQLAGQTIGVAADIYALGVLGYELLTGALPYRPKRPTAAAMEEAILEGDAPPASRRVTDPATRRALHGEIDAILAKAMQRQPQHRYATADALADDIQRQLDGAVVLARPSSPWYRWGKTLRRHRVAFAAGAAVLVAIVGGSAIAVLQAQRAAEAAERARVVKQFVTEVFRANAGIGPNGEDLRRQSPELLLTRGAQLIETRFAQQPALRAELFGVVGGIYAEMGAYRLAADYTGRQVSAMQELVPSADEHHATLMKWAEALVQDEDAVAAEKVVREALKGAEANPAHRYDALVMLARVHYLAGKPDDSRSMLEVARKLKSSAGLEPRIADAWAVWLVSTDLVQANQFELGKAKADEAILLAQGIEGSLSPTADELRLSLVGPLLARSRVDEAKSYADPALARLRAGGNTTRIRAVVLAMEFAAADYPKDRDQTRRKFEASLADLRTADPPVAAELLARAEGRLARLEGDDGNTTRALELVSRIRSVLAGPALPPRRRRDLVMIVGDTLRRAGEHAQADQYLRERLALRRQLGGGEHPFAAVDHVLIALNLTMAGRLDDAGAVLDAAPHYPPLNDARDPDPDRFRRSLVEMRARIHMERGDFAGARELLGAPTEPSWMIPEVIPAIMHGEILCRLGQPEAGLTLLEPWAVERAKDNPLDVDIAHSRALTGLCALSAGKRHDAERWATKAREAFAHQSAVSPWFKKPLIELEQRLGRK